MLRRSSSCRRGVLSAAAAAALLSLATGDPALAREADGTLGLIQRPASTHPELLLAGDAFTIVAEAPEDARGWSAELGVEGTSLPPVELPVLGEDFDALEGRWELRVEVPAGTPEELYDLRVTNAAGGDTSRIAVKVFDEWPERYTFAHFADTQNLGLPGVTPTMRGIIRDLNTLQPTFAVVTGDLVSVGEPYEYRDYIEMLEEARVPIFHVPGNHDVFWVRCGKREAYQERYERFVGPRDYSFEFGDHFFAGFEISGYKNLCPHTKLEERQIEWLDEGLAAHASSPFKVLFGHQLEYKADALESLVFDHDVDMYLYGHVHEDAVAQTDPAIFAAVGWAGNGHYRLIDVEDDEVVSYTYADGDIDSVFGAYAISKDIRRGPAPREATIKYTSGLAQRFEGLSARIEMPPEGEGRYVVDRGEIEQRVSGADADYLYIREIDVEADTVTLANISWIPPEDGDGDDGRDEPGAPPADSAGAGGCQAGGAPGTAGAGLALLLALAARRRIRAARG